MKSSSEEHVSRKTLKDFFLICDCHVIFAIFGHFDNKEPMP